MYLNSSSVSWCGLVFYEYSKHQNKQPGQFAFMKPTKTTTSVTKNNSAGAQANVNNTAVVCLLHATWTATSWFGFLACLVFVVVNWTSSPSNLNELYFHIFLFAKQERRETTADTCSVSLWLKTNVCVGETERCCASALRLFCLLWLFFYGS